MQWLIDIICDCCKVYTDAEIAKTIIYIDQQNAIQRVITDAAILNGKNMPPGSIVGWYGLIPTIPEGWYQCNGSNGTPDLRGKFLRSSGDGILFDSFGGSSDHLHELDEDHEHTIPGGSNIQSGTGYDSGTASSGEGSATTVEDNIPPYHAFWWIMKLP